MAHAIGHSLCPAIAPRLFIAACPGARAQVLDALQVTSGRANQVRPHPGAVAAIIISMRTLTRAGCRRRARHQLHLNEMEASGPEVLLQSVAHLRAVATQYHLVTATIWAPSATQREPTR